MGYRPHIQTKHIIETGDAIPDMNFKSQTVWNFFLDNDVDVIGGGEYGENSEWELEKDQLKAIPEEAFVDRDEITGEQFRELVKGLIAAPTGEYAYLSWC